MKAKFKLLRAIRKRQSNLNVLHKKQSKKVKRNWSTNFVIRLQINKLESVIPFVESKSMPPLM
jgi:hypothetical protein